VIGGLTDPLVATEDSLCALAAYGKQHLGEIDIWINNAYDTRHTHTHTHTPRLIVWRNRLDSTECVIVNQWRHPDVQDAGPQDTRERAARWCAPRLSALIGC
jgi:hypothetical protein